MIVSLLKEKVLLMCALSNMALGPQPPMWVDPSSPDPLETAPYFVHDVCDKYIGELRIECLLEVHSYNYGKGDLRV